MKRFIPGCSAHLTDYDNLQSNRAWSSWVRAAYQELSKRGEGKDALQYLSRIVEAKEAERSEHSGRNLDKLIGVELAARECLAIEYSSQHRGQEALQMLDHCESLLGAHVDAVSPGFLARDWGEISKLSFELGFPFAALRRAGCGLTIDPESAGLARLSQN